jgi:mannose-6-phosphate isomerase
MGTHPSLPSKDLQTGRTLLDLVGDNEALMSSEITQKYSKKLPFLFKVLSINKALSIQAHPNKKLAEQLHAKNPKNYPDDNHKPEMTIAITPFEGFCGFRPLAEIAHFLRAVPALRTLVGEEQAKSFEETSKKDDKDANKKALQSLFTALMSSSKDAIASATDTLLSQAKSEGESFAGSGGPSNTGAELAELVERLNGQFPNDIGLFVLFFLNYVKLNPGEAMFLCADDIHAYISGDIIECMASSDNVVRAGFTPKFKDVDTLTSMLTFVDPSISNPSPCPYPSVPSHRTLLRYV